MIQSIAKFVLALCVLRKLCIERDDLLDYSDACETVEKISAERGDMETNYFHNYVTLNETMLKTNCSVKETKFNFICIYYTQDNKIQEILLIK